MAVEAFLKKANTKWDQQPFGKPKNSLYFFLFLISSIFFLPGRILSENHFYRSNLTYFHNLILAMSNLESNM